jgi:hypothetical protein
MAVKSRPPRRNTGDLPFISAPSAHGLLLALFPHLRNRLADMVLSEAKEIYGLEQRAPGRVWINDAEIPPAELRAEAIHARLEALANLDTRRGRQPRAAVYREYAQAMNLVERAVKQYWLPLSTVRNPRPVWRRLLLQLWDVLSAWPKPIRPSRPLPEAVVDRAMTAKTPSMASRAIVAAAAGIADTDSFRRRLAAARAELKS